MKNIYIVRHGQTNQNVKVLIQGRSNTVLNETGIMQAKETAKILKGIKIDEIYSSPLDRAYQTACIIKDELNLNCDVVKNEGLIERDFGSSEGHKVESIYFENVINGKVEDAEHNEILQKRAFNTLKDIIRNSKNDNILIVSHAHLIKGIIISLGYPNYDYHSPLFNASLTYIKYDNDQFNIIDVNKK